MRDLRGGAHYQTLVTRIEVREHHACFQWLRANAMRDDVLVDHQIGRRERAVDIAMRETVLKL